MNLFGLTFEEAGTNFPIDKREKEWVEEVIYYLLEIFGLPEEQEPLVLLNTDFFPFSLPEKQANIAHIIQELSFLLKLDAGAIKHACYEELIQEESHAELLVPFGVDTLFEEDGPLIVYKEKLRNRPKKLIFLVLYELLHIRLIENKAAMKASEGVGPFMAQVAVFLGFGILTARNLYSEGSVNQQYWKSKWVRPQITSDPCIAYALALYARIRNDKNPEWTVLLPKTLRPVFREAIGYTANASVPFEKGLKFQIITHLEKASRLHRNKDYKGASKILRELVEQHTDDEFPARVYGNLGYYLSMDEQFEQSIPYFEKALEIKSDLSYVQDNLGFAYLKLGELKKGKKHISLSLKGMKNDIAYSFRNLAIYHQAKGEMDKAEEFFDLSYENNTQGVDLLDYHYATFLLEIGKKKKGKKYMKKAADAGEPVAIQIMAELFGAT